VSSTHKRVAVAGALALALGVVVGPGTAAAAKKVSKSSAGGPVPPAIENPFGADAPVPFVQTFKLKGKKVKRKKIVDVNLTVSASGNGPSANADLSATLVDPRGDANTIVDPKGGSVGLPIPDIGSSMQSLLFKDQSIFIPCSPFGEPRFNCNYLQGANEDATVGTMTGELNSVITPPFEDKNPKGTWKLVWRDGDADAVTTVVGESTLTIKVAKRKPKGK
jgi:hypothetical protein